LDNNDLAFENHSDRLILAFLKLFIIFISLFSYREVYNFRVNQQLIIEIFIITLMVIWLIKILSSEKIIWVKSRLNFPLFIFVVIITVSFFTKSIKEVALYDYINFISYVLLYLAVINFIKQEKEVNHLLKIFFITSFLVALYTLLQYYGLDPYYGHLGTLTSTIGQKNWISNYLVMIFPVVFSFFLLADDKKNKSLYLFLLVILYATLLICQSRGIWISITLTTVFAFIVILRYKLGDIFKSNKKWLIILFTVFLVITIIYSTENPLNKSRLTVIERAASTFDQDDPSINTRFLIWGTSLEMMEDKPLLGLGIGTFKYHYLDYQAEYLRQHPHYIKNSGKAAEAHNEYLQLVAEIGIVGLISFLGIIISFFFLIYQYLESKKNKEVKNKEKMMVIVIFGLLMGITCFLIHCLFTFPFHVPVLGATFFILLSLTMVIINLEEEENQDYSKQYLRIIKLNLNPILKYISIALVLLLAVWEGWELAIKPYLAEIDYFKGAKCFTKQDNSKALEYFQKAAFLDSGNGRILHALGSAYYQLGLQEEAQKILEKTKTIYKDRNIYRNMGLSLMESGDYDRAEDEFKKAIKLDPKFYEAYHDLASWYVYQEEYQKAIEQWERAINLGFNFEEKHIFLYFIGIAWERMGDTEQAYHYFLEALKEAPDDSLVMADIEQELLNIYCHREGSH